MWWKRRPGRRPATPRERGREAERLVAAELRERGLRVIERNVVIGKVGEIDIVAREGEILCFVEVRSRSRQDLGAPWETVGPRKRQKLRRLAALYMARRGFDGPARFDVASVSWSEDGHARIDYFENAFE